MNNLTTPTNQPNIIEQQNQSTEPQPQPLYIDPQQSGQPEAKEFITLEFANGSKIILGSCSLRIDELCNLTQLLKENLLDSNTKSQPSYTQ